MLSRLSTYTIFGIEALSVHVEVDISPGALPKTTLVGLAEAAVKESIHRIERALVNSGYRRPVDRIVINLSPADLPKDAASLDLPIALGLLAADSQVVPDPDRRVAYIGELALDGTVRPVRGALSMALAARDAGMSHIVVPAGNAKEAAVVEGIDVISVGVLPEAVGFMTGQLSLDPVEFSWQDARRSYGTYDLDYLDVKGQEAAKRAVTVAAAGCHHLLMIGSPGTARHCYRSESAQSSRNLSPKKVWKQLVSTARLLASNPASRSCCDDRFVHRITPSAKRVSSAAAVFLNQEKSVSRITEFCFWMNCRSLIAGRSK